MRSAPSITGNRKPQRDINPCRPSTVTGMISKATVHGGTIPFRLYAWRKRCNIISACPHIRRTPCGEHQCLWIITDPEQSVQSAAWPRQNRSAMQLLSARHGCRSSAPRGSTSGRPRVGAPAGQGIATIKPLKQAQLIRHCQHGTRDLWQGLIKDGGGFSPFSRRAGSPETRREASSPSLSSVSPDAARAPHRCRQNLCAAPARGGMIGFERINLRVADRGQDYAGSTDGTVTIPGGYEIAVIRSSVTCLRGTGHKYAARP